MALIRCGQGAEAFCIPEGYYVNSGNAPSAITSGQAIAGDWNAPILANVKGMTGTASFSGQGTPCAKKFNPDGTSSIVTTAGSFTIDDLDFIVVWSGTGNNVSLTITNS